jgi:hypothetical protein
MKKTLIGLTLLISMSTFANGTIDKSYDSLSEYNSNEAQDITENNDWGTASFKRIKFYPTSATPDERIELLLEALRHTPQVTTPPCSESRIIKKPYSSLAESSSTHRKEVKSDDKIDKEVIDCINSTKAYRKWFSLAEDFQKHLTAGKDISIDATCFLINGTYCLGDVVEVAGDSGNYQITNVPKYFDSSFSFQLVPVSMEENDRWKKGNGLSSKAYKSAGIDMSRDFISIDATNILNIKTLDTSYNALEAKERIDSKDDIMNYCVVAAGYRAYTCMKENGYYE